MTSKNAVEIWFFKLRAGDTSQDRTETDFFYLLVAIFSFDHGIKLTGNVGLAETFWYRRWQNEEHDDKVTLRRNEANKDWTTTKLMYDEVTFNEMRLGDEISQWLDEMIKTMLNSKLTIFSGIKKFRRHEM